tara:strand:+ start:730 stop:1422 length:693 start_codon:yes stop_codon:yes gene_type:complete
MKKEKVVNYVKSKKRLEYKFKHFSVIITDPLPDNVDISYTFKNIESTLPHHFLNLIDVVYVGDFSFFKERKINAMYADGAMYISNVQDDNRDLKDDIIHEVSHAVDEKFNDVIYYDNKIKKEYFQKLKKLKNYLIFEKYDLRGINFFNEEYNKGFDDFLYKEVGYERLRGLIKDLFLSPYSVTSLREYFAVAFEEYFIGNRIYVKQVSPYVYEKLYFLSNNIEDVTQYES